MNDKKFITISSAIFLIVAIAHLVRAYFGWALIIGEWCVPVWGSLVAAGIIGILGLAGIRLAKKEQKPEPEQTKSTGPQ